MKYQNPLVFWYFSIFSLITKLYTVNSKVYKVFLNSSIVFLNFGKIYIFQEIQIYTVILKLIYKYS